MLASEREGTTPIRVARSVAEKVTKMAEADYRERPRWLNWLVDQEWTRRDPESGKRLEDPQHAMRAEIAVLRDRLANAERQIEIIRRSGGA